MTTRFAFTHDKGAAYPCQLAFARAMAPANPICRKLIQASEANPARGVYKFEELGQSLVNLQAAGIKDIYVGIYFMAPHWTPDANGKPLNAITGYDSDCSHSTVRGTEDWPFHRAVPGPNGLCAHPGCRIPPLPAPLYCVSKTPLKIVAEEVEEFFFHLTNVCVLRGVTTIAPGNEPAGSPPYTLRAADEDDEVFFGRYVTEFLAPAAAGCRRAFKDVKIVGPESYGASDLLWILAWEKRLGLRLFDTIGMHAYPEDAGKTVEGSLLRINQALSAELDAGPHGIMTVKQAIDGRPLWVSEGGIERLATEHMAALEALGVTACVFYDPRLLFQSALDDNTLLPKGVAGYVPTPELAKVMQRYGVPRRRRGVPS